MTQSNKPISPLRQRILQDMAIGRFSPGTQRMTIHAVVNFTRFLRRSPDSADAEDLQCYQLHMVEQSISNTTINANITGLKFFFGTTLDRPEAVRKRRLIYEPRRLPEILSAQEVTRLREATCSLKYQAALGVA